MSGFVYSAVFMFPFYSGRRKSQLGPGEKCLPRNGGLDYGSDDCRGRFSSLLSACMIVHSAFPTLRPRRLRRTPALRRLVAETRLSVEQLVLPLFVRSGKKLRRPIAAMPGVFQLSPDELVREAAIAHELGVPAVLLFGIPDRKDDKASGAYAANGIVQQAVRRLKKELPQLLVITDVCLCEYMEHGHCGVVQRGKGGARILNDPTLELLARAAASHVEAG